MAYNPNIPGPNDALSQSQGQIKDNFTSLGGMLIPDQATIKFTSSSDPTALLNTPQVYAKDGYVGKQIFLERPSNYVAITDEPVIYNFTEALHNDNGWTRLPSGILMKWGTVTGMAKDNANNIVFPVSGTIPAFKNIFSAQCTPIGGSGNVGNLFITSKSLTQLVVWIWGSGAGFTSCYYLAFGD